jgi:hypothetical protein
MRSLTTPPHQLCNVVRDDKRLLFRGKRGRAEQNPVLSTNHFTARPRFPMQVHVFVIPNRRTTEVEREEAVRDLLWF